MGEDFRQLRLHGLVVGEQPDGRLGLGGQRRIREARDGGEPLRERGMGIEPSGPGLPQLSPAGASRDSDHLVLLADLPESVERIGERLSLTQQVLDIGSRRARPRLTGPSRPDPPRAS